MKFKKIISSFLIGILIILVPNIIIGRPYNDITILGNKANVEIIMRSISAIIGLLVIYDGIKNSLE